MGLFDSIGGAVGGAFGGLAGIPAGLPGMLFGSQIGNRVGNNLWGGPANMQQGNMPPMNYPAYVGMEPQDLAGGFMQNAPLNKFAGESMRGGPSDITKFALKRNAMGADRSRANAQKLAGGMAQNAEANLAMRGGLGAGARQGIQKQAMNSALDFSNQADANASANRANLLVADEAQRSGNLGQAAGLVGNYNQQGYNMMAGDIGRKQGELDRKNLYNMNNYNQQMAGWAAGRQADAVANSGGRGIFGNMFGGLFG